MTHVKMNVFVTRFCLYSASASTRSSRATKTPTMPICLRHDPAFQILADQPLGEALGSQPTLSRWENAPSAREIIRLQDALLDWFVSVCGEQVRKRGEILLDVDSTDDPTSWAATTELLPWWLRPAHVSSVAGLRTPHRLSARRPAASRNGCQSCPHRASAVTHDSATPA